MQILIDTPEDGARAVDRLAAAGVDVIKAYVQLTPAHYRAIVEAAHRHKLRVHAHLYAERDVRNALDAGVDVLTHVGSGGTAPPYSPQLVQDINVNLVWGIVLAVFGGLMLALARQTGRGRPPSNSA